MFEVKVVFFFSFTTSGFCFMCLNIIKIFTYIVFQWFCCFMLYINIPSIWIYVCMCVCVCMLSELYSVMQLLCLFLHKCKINKLNITCFNFSSYMYVLFCFISISVTKVFCIIVKNFWLFLQIHSSKWHLEKNVYSCVKQYHATFYWVKVKN